MLASRVTLLLFQIAVRVPGVRRARSGRQCMDWGKSILLLPPPLEARKIPFWWGVPPHSPVPL